MVRYSSEFNHDITNVMPLKTVVILPFGFELKVLIDEEIESRNAHECWVGVKKQ